ncbi:MAG TPA: zinc ribbon domain-containing protein [Paracoccus sp. (in: a-proteobacteria)]|uniref:Zn-ribbon domain-containing OB-fold protein n=1 Tax=Paracoccus sp. TaxID=267 RepID=UPI002BDA36AC|nr:zinc ribbon domain-containing protein [Paracoccus sp. (in: a-proteobacteria)]HWL56833.1 zinc ribbon domain-containing protein [Paracoccus sp. (in: a-proteobacteria)]
MPASQRIAPVPTIEDRPFWEGCARQVLTLAQCRDCGRIPFPPRPRCPECLTDALEWVVLSGRARLRGWTDNHVARLAGYGVPLCIAECALEEDPQAILVVVDRTGSVRSCPPDAPVQIVFNSDPNGWCYPEVISDVRADAEGAAAEGMGA